MMRDLLEGDILDLEPRKTLPNLPSLKVIKTKSVSSELNKLSRRRCQLGKLARTCTEDDAEEWTYVKFSEKCGGCE